MSQALCSYAFSSTRTPGPYTSRHRSLNAPTSLVATSFKNIEATWNQRKTLSNYLQGFILTTIHLQSNKETIIFLYISSIINNSQRTKNSQFSSSFLRLLTISKFQSLEEEKNHNFHVDFLDYQQFLSSITNNWTLTSSKVLRSRIYLAIERWVEFEIHMEMKVASSWNGSRLKLPEVYQMVK